MPLYLSHLKLDKYLSEDRPVSPVGDTGVVVLAIEEAWIHGDYMCKRVILGRLSTSFMHYILRKKLLRRYGYIWGRITKADVMMRQHFATEKFLHFQIVDSKPIV